MIPTQLDRRPRPAAEGMWDEWLPEEGECRYCGAPAILLRERSEVRVSWGDFVYCQNCNGGYWERCSIAGWTLEMRAVDDRAWEVLDEFLALAKERGFWTQTGPTESRDTRLDNLDPIDYL